MSDDQKNKLSIVSYKTKDGMQCDVEVIGDLEELSRSLLAIMQTDQRVAHIVVDTVVNAMLGNKLNVSKLSYQEGKPENDTANS